VSFLFVRSSINQVQSQSAYPSAESADFYVSASAGGSGDGSFGSPWTPTQALALATASTFEGRNTYICWLAGNGSLYTRASNTTHHTSGGLPSFSPANSGRSSTEKIIHFAEYAGANLSTPLTNADRTELAHDGTSQVGGGDDKAHIGFVGVSNVEMLGFVLSHSNGAFGIDEGAVLFYHGGGSCTGCAVRWCYIDGIGRSGDYSVEDHSNPSAVWADNITDMEFTDNDVRNFIFSGANNRNVAGLTCYSVLNGLIANNRFTNIYNAIYIKGNSGGSGATENYLIVEKNDFADCPNGMFMQETHATNVTRVRQNLLRGISEVAISYANAGSTPCRNTRAYNNTIILDAGSGVVAAFGSLDAANFGADNWNHDNIVVVTSGSTRNHVDLSSSTSTFGRLRSNLYWNGSAGGFRGQWNSSTQTTLANWQSMLETGNPVNSRDENSSVDDPDFASTTTGVLNVGSPALTMGSSDGIGGIGGQIGCHASSPTIGPRA
jgi:hypothetical protein